MSTASVIDIGKERTSVDVTLSEFKKLFNNLCATNIDQIRDVYSTDVSFQDPLSEVKGIDALSDYLKDSYANVLFCQFDFGDPVINGEDVCIPWVMRLKHKRIRKGAQINVDGISQLVIHNNQVTFHRDYFDVGQLLYENLPIFGKAIRWIRSQAG